MCRPRPLRSAAGGRCHPNARRRVSSAMRAASGTRHAPAWKTVTATSAYSRQRQTHLDRRFLRSRSGWVSEHRTRATERVELAALAAGIDGWRQLRQQRGVIGSAGKTPVELLGIDARQDCAEAGGKHFPRERPGRLVPERKQRIDPRACQPLFAIPSDILEKEIAERDVREAFRACARHRVAHALFVDLVRTGRRNQHRPERDAAAAACASTSVRRTACIATRSTAR